MSRKCKNESYLKRILSWKKKSKESRNGRDIGAELRVAIAAQFEPEWNVQIKDVYEDDDIVIVKEPKNINFRTKFWFFLRSSLNPFF